MPQFLAYSDDVEQLEDHEATTTEALVNTVGRGNKVTCDHYRRAVRGAHAKSHGILKGKLTVFSDLAPEYRQGIFAEAQAFDIVARLSSAPGDILPDSVSTARGFALKVLNVPGDPLTGHAGGTQDFVMASGLSFPFKNVSSFLAQQKLLEASVDYLVRSKDVVSTAARVTNAALSVVGLETPKLGLMGYSTRHLLGDEYGTQAPIRFGKYIAKLALRPSSKSVKALENSHHKIHENFSALQLDVQDFFKKEEAEYDLCVQLCTDLDSMPVEDATVAWPEEKSPYVPVASIKFSQQDPFTPARRIFGDDSLSFSPWHAVAAHRPLGRIMRARKPVYDSSANFRAEQNASKKVEPKSAEEIPN